MNMEVATNESFETKMKNRIRDSIGDLLSDEDLDKMVRRGLEEAFFTKRTKKTSGYPYQEETTSLMHEIVTELLQPAVEKSVNNYLVEHQEEVKEIIERVVTLGIGNATLKAMDYNFNGALSMLQGNINNQLQSLIHR
jgi:hypothetical protein